MVWGCLRWHNILIGFCENRLDSLSGDSQTVRRGIFKKHCFFLSIYAYCSFKRLLSCYGKYLLFVLA